MNITELQAHMKTDHAIYLSLPHDQLTQMHELDHAEGMADDHNHDEPAVEEQSSEFEQFVRAEAEKKMIEARKVHDAGWQRIAAAVQEAGQAKANLNEARALGTNVMQAASTFRTAELTMLEAVNNMVDQIAKEHAL